MSLSYRRMRHSRTGSVMILTNDAPAFQQEFFICSFGDFLQRRPVAFPFKKVTSAASLGLMAGLPLALPGQMVFGSNHPFGPCQLLRLKGTVQLKLTGAESDIYRKVFLSH